MASTSKHKDAAYLFIQWLNSEKISTERVQLPYTLRDPYRLSQYTSPLYRSLWPAAKDYLLTLADAANYGVVDMIMPGWQDYALSLDRMCTAVWAGQDPKAGLEAAQDALKFAKKVDQPDAQVRCLIVLGELKMASSPAAAKRSFQEASQLAEARVPHLLRVVFDRWSRAAEAKGDSDEALRLARRALETART